jgi:transcriptional regulator GlxA family with amidase domain
MYLNKSETDANNNRFTFIIKYIRDNLTNELTIEQLSKKVQMSESNFYRTFKKNFNS